MILATALINAPLCAVVPDDLTTIHRVEMEGLPVRDWATADHATAVCGASVKLMEVRWGDLRTRGTGIRRCAGCRTKRTTS